MKVRTEVSAATLRSSEVATSLRSTSKTAARRDRNASLTATFAGLLALLLLPVGWTSVQAATAAGGAKAKVHQAPARSARTFSLDFIDTDVVDVLKALSTQSGANIVATGGVKGKTTLSLRNVTMEEALRLVCASAGLDYAWADTAYVVGTPEEMRGLRVKELSSRTVVLHQVSAKYAQEVLKQAAPDITVSYQDGASAVVLLGTGQSLSRAERILAEIDVPSPPTSKMYWLAHASAEKVTDLLTKAVPEASAIRESSRWVKQAV